MDIFDLAMNMEKEGEAFYRELAAQELNPGFSKIFLDLAEDEVKHHHIFKNMKENHLPFVQSNEAANVKESFKEMIVGENLKDLDQSQLHLYQKAMELEKQSREFYLNKAKDLEDEAQRTILNQIAAEEEKHYYLLHNIYELVLRPQTWVENGEFVHLEEY